MITVKNLIQMKGSQLWFIRPDANVLQALELMTQKDIGALPVLDETKLVGIISERDIVQMLSHAKTFYPEETIEKYMTREVIVTNLDTTVEECMTLMTNYHIRHLPVVEEGKLIGLISIGDVVKSIISDRDDMINNLEDYIVGRGYGK
jgi:CBS domain-containing protein